MVRPVGQQAGSTDEDGVGGVVVTDDDAVDVESFEVGKAVDGREWADAFGGGSGDRLGDWVFGRLLEGAGEAEDLVDVLAVGGYDVEERHVAGGHGAGLVGHDRVDRAGGSEDPWSLDDDAELGAAAGADHERGGGWPGRGRTGGR